jgi:peptidoglycan/LPS O-acetylase OafA/YrhL
MPENRSGTAVDAVTPAVRQAGERRSARIESLRALAAVGVLVGHAWGWSHGWQGVYDTYLGRVFLSGGFGVFLFFALSGYLLYLPFARGSFGASGAVQVGRYAANRALRILPLYYVVITTYLVVNGDGFRDDWWRFALFLESFSAHTVATVDPPVWSLVVEVQYYLLLPLFAWVVTRASRRSVPRAAGLVAVLGVAALVLRLTTVTWADHPSAVWRYSLPATCVFFFPGFLLALLRVHLDNARQSWARIPVVGSATGWLGAGAVVWLLVAYRYNLDALLLVSSALLLGACVLPLRADLGLRLLDLRVIAGLGAASYSLYLWHGPIVEALSRASWVPHGFVPLVTVSLLLCSAVAVVSYRVVETPFLRLRRTWSPARLPEQRVMQPAATIPTVARSGEPEAAV